MNGKIMKEWNVYLCSVFGTEYAIDYDDDDKDSEFFEIDLGDAMLGTFEAESEDEAIKRAAKKTGVPEDKCYAWENNSMITAPDGALYSISLYTEGDNVKYTLTRRSGYGANLEKKEFHGHIDATGNLIPDEQ
ncbi:MAG: hypothetical protein Q4B26_20920 [Eubacteriales bacterium]|nr:hypothetical protein [Eubacteriales bacterium]